MRRFPEEELMSRSEQAQAYAAADFETPHSAVIRLFQEIFGNTLPGSSVIDLGCGPGDITFRFAHAYPDCFIHGVDGSAAMLAEARRSLARRPELAGRVLFMQGMLPDFALALPQYDVVISSSLLHHLPEPSALWETIKCCAATRRSGFHCRPQASRNHKRGAAAHNTVLQRDFYNSLCAALEPLEIREQLRAARLDGFEVREISDRHVMIAGFIKQ